MSDKPKFSRLLADGAARRLMMRLATAVVRSQVVGSMRRDRPTVGDVEILYIPKLVLGKPTDFFSPAPTVNCADECLDLMVSVGVLKKRLKTTGSLCGWGKENKFAVDVASGIPFDFFATTEENWWVSLVIRTGGKDTNLMLTTGANRLNRTLNAYGAGITDRATGEIIPATSEQHVFELCGCEYVEPEKRR